jgi:hypothetical protein
VAAAVGVNQALVFKWLRGDCRPKPEMQQRVAAWIQSHENAADRRQLGA